MVETSPVKEIAGSLKFNYFSLLVTLSAARTYFEALLIDRNRSQDNAAFKKFTKWIDSESELRRNVIEKTQEPESSTSFQSQNADAYSEPAGTFFEMIVATESTLQKKDIPTAFATQRAVFVTGMQKRMVGQTYKWVC